MEMDPDTQIRVRGMIAWSSMEGSFKCIIAVSFTVRPASRKMKGGILLWSMDGTEMIFLAINI